GIPQSTLRHWRDGETVPKSEAFKALVASKARTLEELWETTAYAYLERLLDVAVIGKARAKDCALIAGIAIDKLRQLRDDPREQASAALADAETAAKIASLIAKAEAARAKILAAAGQTQVAAPSAGPAAPSELTGVTAGTSPSASGKDGGAGNAGG